MPPIITDYPYYEHRQVGASLSEVFGQDKKNGELAWRYFPWSSSINQVIPPNTISSNYTSIQSVSLVEQVKNARKEITGYTKLEYGWDGYNAHKISESVVSKALESLEWVSNFFEDEGTFPSEITPCPISDGSVDIEVNNKNASFILTIIPDSERLNIFYEDHKFKTEIEGHFRKTVVFEYLFRLIT